MVPFNPSAALPLMVNALVLLDGWNSKIPVSGPLVVGVSVTAPFPLKLIDSVLPVGITTKAMALFTTT